MKKQNILIIGLILLAVISFGIFILVSGKENTGSLETTKDIIKMINIIDKDNKKVCIFIISPFLPSQNLSPTWIINTLSLFSPPQSLHPCFMSSLPPR